MYLLGYELIKDTDFNDQQEIWVEIKNIKDYIRNAQSSGLQWGVALGSSKTITVNDIFDETSKMHLMYRTWDPDIKVPDLIFYWELKDL